MIDRFVTRSGPIVVRDGLAWAMQLIEGGNRRGSRRHPPSVLWPLERASRVEPGEAHLVLFTLHGMLDMAELDAALGRLEGYTGDRP